jgi:hypothetical protein
MARVSDRTLEFRAAGRTMGARKPAPRNAVPASANCGRAVAHVRGSYGPRPCENPTTWGAPAHFTAAELLIRWNGPPVISVATGSFM